MRLATVALPDGSTSAAAHDGANWRSLPAPDLSLLLTRTTVAAIAHLVGDDLVDAVPVLPLPHPRKVLCCGLNYAEHIVEMGRDLPTHPTLFAKFADTLTGPTDDVVLPSGSQGDWEVELAVVVGAPLRHATAEEARAAIAGHMVANDISLRDWQHRTTEWLQGKAWDRTTPTGPVMVTPDEFDPTAGARIVCRVNGVIVQDDDVRTLVFDTAELLAYASTFTRLQPGDVLLTGTPGGVGAGRTPPKFLADGDLLESEIAGLGVLRNTISIAS